VVNAFDPFCPHIGAHFKLGKVVGEDLQCAFHHWSFNGQGGVSDIPYSDLIPPKLKRSCVRTWPVEERAGSIFVWNHPRNAAPKWELAVAPEVETEGWVPAGREEWTIKIHIQEITENGADYPHFRSVHGTQGPPASEFKLEGWTRRNVVETQMVTPRGPMLGKIDTLAVGPGQSFVRFTDVTNVLLVQQTTPIDHETTRVQFLFYHPKDLSEGKMRVTAARIRDLTKQIVQDIPIWECKRFQPEPLLVKGDGPILSYRQQYARFYDFDDDAEPAVAAAS
jgi:nitrite reductase/ring-hydroxylating ferredoxin subunit